MKYRAENFSEEERNNIIQLGKIVAYVFKIDESDLRSHVRKRAFTDARKALASISSGTIQVKNCDRFERCGYNKLSLTAWYLDFDHSTVSYAADRAGELYIVDKHFKLLYDSIMELVNNPDEGLLDRINSFGHELDTLTWKEVRDNTAHTHKLRYSLAPQEVIEGISDLYRRGYNSTIIASKYDIIPSFIGYVVKLNNVEKKSAFSKSFMTTNQLISRRSATLAPQVKHSNTIDY